MEFLNITYAFPFQIYVDAQVKLWSKECIIMLSHALFLYELSFDSAFLCYAPFILDDRMTLASIHVIARIILHC